MNVSHELSDQVVEWSPSAMLEITLAQPDDFLKVKESLTRIGVSSQRLENTLYQSCHILHKQGRYFIVHFKELFLLDGKASAFTEDDLARRNAIATLLEDWGLLTIVDKSKALPQTSLRNIKVIKFSEKPKWRLETKYSIGNVHSSLSK